MPTDYSVGIFFAQQLLVVELVHYARNANKRQLLHGLAAKVDALIDFGLLLIGPLAEHEIDLMTARELVADAKTHTRKIGG